MKVLVINWRDIENPEAGGAEIHIDEILKRKPAGWTVDFVSASFPGCAPETDKNGYHITRIPNNAIFNFTFRNYWNRVLSKRGYDLIIDDVSKIPLATPDYIRNTPVVGILHHIHGKSLYQQLSWPMALYVSVMERFYLRAYRQIPFVVVSESTRKELSGYYTFNRAEVSYNGIDYPHLHQAFLPPAEKKNVALYFGRLKKYKRIDHVISAFGLLQKRLPDSKLLIAGKGDDEGRLKELVREAGLSDSIEFLGFIDEEAKLEVFRKSRVYAIASEKEGWGISVIESAAAGLPSVAYDVEGLRESIRNGETGLLAENGNVTDLADKMIALLTDPVLLDKYSKASVEWAARFSWDNTAAEFIRICEKAVSQFKK